MLFVSGYAPDLQSVKEAGRLLEKPFKMTSLLRAVRRVLDERKAEPADGVAPPGSQHLAVPRTTESPAQGPGAGAPGSR